MHMNSRRLATLLWLVLSITSLNALSEDAVKVAFLVPLSGPFAIVGETQIKHAQFFADRINASGGVMGGRKLEIVPMDNKNSPQEAMLLVNQIADRGIRFVSHCCASHVAVALSDAIEKRNSRQPESSMLLFVEVGDWDVVNDRCSFWTFSFYASGEMMLEALTTVAAKQSNIKRVHLINPDYNWGHQNQRFTREMLARKRPDIQIVGDDLFAIGKVKDFAPYVAKIRAAKADAVFTGNWGPDLVLFIKAATESGLHVPVYAPAGFLWGTVTALGTSGVDRVRAAYRWHPNLGVKQERLAMEEYARRYNSQYYAMPAVNELEMLAKALEKTRSTDPLRVASALEGMRIQGSMGEIWMAADNHQLYEPLYVIALSAVNGRDVKYGMEGSAIGTRTEARLEAANLVTPLRCKMQRPSRP